MIRKNLTIKKVKALNKDVWHGIDYNDVYGILNDDIAYKSYPIIDLSKPYGEMSADIREELEGVSMDFLIINDGHAVFINEN